MRLWHQSLIPYLPRQQLLGQHRECCALRGNGWGRKHATVDYAFKYNPAYLVAYHYLIMNEMKNRNYKPDMLWMSPNWRGNTLKLDTSFADPDIVYDTYKNATEENQIIYPEHNDKYLQECLDNLKSKGINIDFKGRE